MVVVGVSRHGRLRRLFTGTTGDRIAQLAGSIDVHLVTHDEVVAPAPAASVAVLSPLSRAGSSRAGRSRCSCPSLLTVVLAGLRTTTDQLPLAVLLFLAGTVLVALSAGCCPRCSRRSPASCCSTGSSRRRSASSPSPSRPTWSPCWSTWRSRSASPPWSTAPRGARPRRCGPAPRRPPWLALAVGAHRPGHRRGDRRAAARVVRPARRSSLLAQSDGPAGSVLAVERRPTRPLTPTTADTRVTVDDDHVLALCGAPLRATDQRVLEALRPADQPGAGVPAAARARGAGGRPWSAPRRRAPRCCARSPTTCGRRWRRCAPPSTGSWPAGPLGRRPTGRAGRRARRLDRPARARSSTTCSTCPGSSPACSDPLLRERSLEEILPLAVAGHPPGAVELELDEAAPLVVTDAGLLERVVANLVANAVRALRRQAGAGASPTAARRGRRSSSSTAGPASPGAAGADVRAVPAARRHRRRTASGSGSPSRAAWPTRSAATLEAEDTPGRRAHHGAVGARVHAAGGAVHRGIHGSWWSTTSRRSPGRSRSTCAPTAGRSSPPPTAAPRSPRPPTRTPTSSCSTSGCPTWTAPR